MAAVLTIAALGAGVQAAPAAQAAGGVSLVFAGQSVQAAVDAAAPGGTVMLLPGTYRESVRITKPLTLTGLGPGVTIAPAGTPAAGDTCAAAGHGLCVGRSGGQVLSGVRIQSLTVAGFRKNGINASGTDGMVVRHVLVRDNGEQGISQEKSTRAVLTGNQVRNNGQSGIFIANVVDSEGGALDTRGTVVADNTLTGNRIGMTVRRARVLDVRDNTVTGNCGGVFVVGDESDPKAGDLDIRRNDISANNKYCASNGRLPFIQGTGVLLTGAEDTRISGNRISGNVGASPMSGGVVLYPSNVGVANRRNQVSGNVVSGNAPSDLADRDAKGSGNTFTGNRCQVSEPAGSC